MHTALIRRIAASTTLAVLTLLPATAASARPARSAATPAVSTISLNAAGKPVFSPRSFRLRATSANGCNVTITNHTPAAQALVYGFPGTWKRLPFGTIAPGASLGVGIGSAGYTGYFSTMANTGSYVAIHCI